MLIFLVRRARASVLNNSVEHGRGVRHWGWLEWLNWVGLFLQDSSLLRRYYDNVFGGLRRWRRLIHPHEFLLAHSTRVFIRKLRRWLVKIWKLRGLLGAAECTGQIDGLIALLRFTRWIGDVFDLVLGEHCWRLLKVGLLGYGLHLTDLVHSVGRLVDVRVLNRYRAANGFCIWSTAGCLR